VIKKHQKHGKKELPPLLEIVSLGIKVGRENITPPRYKASWNHGTVKGKKRIRPSSYKYHPHQMQNHSFQHQKH
jgi:hypothetical protein